MKKNIMKVALAAAVAAMAGYGVYENQSKEMMSDVLLANVEALARYELPEVEITCQREKNQGDGACWMLMPDCSMGWFLRADDCIFSGYIENHCLTPCD